MKEVNWVVKEDKLHNGRFVAMLDNENGELVDWMVGSFELVKNYIGEQCKDLDRFSVTWQDGHKATYLSFKIA